MKIQDFMTGKTPDPTYKGIEMTQDNVLAIGKTQADTIKDYLVLFTNIEGYDPNINGETASYNFMQGKADERSGMQRSFNITGKRLHGDEAQDFLLSHIVKYGTGSAVELPYIYFNQLTGIGEKGIATANVNTDGGGNAQEASSIAIELKVKGIPEQYIWS